MASVPREVQDIFLSRRVHFPGPFSRLGARTGALLSVERVYYNGVEAITPGSPVEGALYQVRSVLPAMMTMGIFHQIPPWNVLVLICAVLLLTTLIPLGRFRRHRDLAKERSKRAWFANLQKELEETKDLKQFGEKALGVALRVLGATGGCVLLQGEHLRGASYKGVQGLSSRTADLLTADPLHPYLAMAAKRWGALMVFSDLHKPDVVTAWQRDPESNGFIGIMKAEGLRSAVLIGLGTQGKCYGALLAGSRKERLLNSHQLRQALLMGNLVSAAIESWIGKQKTERHNQEFRVLYRIGLALRETFDFKTQIEILRREMKDLWGDKDFALSLQSSRAGILETVVPFERARELEFSLGRPTSRLEDQVMRTRSPLVVSVDWREGAQGPEGSAGGLRKRSWCGVHVALSDGTMGVLAMVDYHSAITEKQLELFQVVAKEATKAFENARMYQAAFQQAITDGLTGVKTHRYFMEAVEREWRRSTRSGQEFSVIMLDLDRFKDVNDRYGHLQGDRVLRAVAEVLSESVRQSSVVARYGGDEFSILMPEATTAQAGTIAERMRGEIETDPLLKAHGITASFGIGTFPVHGPTIEEVLQVADASMYRAKNQSGNCVRVGPLTPAIMNEGWEQSILAADFDIAPGQVFCTGSEAFNEYLNRIEEASRKAAGELFLMDTVTSLARAIDFSDHYTRDHGQAVSRWAVCIARQLGLPHEDIEDIRLAGVLHDIGKVGIPLEVLSKPARLTPEEYELVKSHSVLGERILAPLMMGSIKRISRMVRHHHEAFDGNGYPDRLKGECIPLGARILAVADAFDTMVSDRAYKTGHTYKDAVFELHRCCGTQFDPQLVDSLLRAGGDLKSLSLEI